MVFADGSFSERAFGELSGASSGATAVTLGGPGNGYLATASAPFTVAANGTITGTVTVTPNDGGVGGSFSPSSVQISAGSPTATFTYTPSSIGARTINITNNGGLSNPSGIAFSAASNLPGKPTSVVAAAGNGSATVSFVPGNTGGSAVTYTVTATPGGASNTGSASPIDVPGLTNGVAYTFVVTPANVNGTGTASDPSNSVTPAPLITICKLAPFVDSDVLGTVVAQAYAEQSGTLAASGTASPINTVALVTNGRQVQVSVAPNESDGSFAGVLRWATGNGEYFVDELNIPAKSFNVPLGNRKLMKVCNLPYGTDVSGTVGYQLFDGAGAAVGSLVTTGIMTVPGATYTDKLCALLDLAAGFSGYIRWTNGAGVYSIDEVQAPGSVPATSTKTVSLTLTTDGTSLAANLSGLKWAFRDSFGGTILSQGTTGTTNSSGVFSVSVTTTLASGGIGWLEVSNSDGTLTQSGGCKGYSGPAAVS